MAKQSSSVGAKRYWREADARQALAALDRSGLSLREYCERTGVSERKLRRWKRRLETATPHSTPGFREVRVVETPVVETASGVEEAVVDIAGEVIAGRYRVRAPLGFDASELRRLIATVAEC
jgi:transposase-like protein